VLELEGCASQGESLDELEKNIRDAVLSVLDVRLERGDDLRGLQTHAEPSLKPDQRYWRIFIPLPVVV
jgi:predicted RNase H-like HicB family nuclease